jgi:hypothetical protein
MQLTFIPLTLAVVRHFRKRWLSGLTPTSKKPKSVCPTPTVVHTVATPAPVAANLRSKPLRVLHLAEAPAANGSLRGAHKAHTGRVLISGRMADVCAELERLAQLEEALTTC